MSLIVNVMGGARVALYPGRTREDGIVLTVIEAPPDTHHVAVVTMTPEDARRIAEGLIAAAER